MADRPLDRIHIRDLQLRCIIGIYPEERREKQDIEIDVTLHADLSKPGKTDNIVDTIDYKEVKKRIVAMVEQSEFYLIEKLATAVAEIGLDASGVERVDVTVDKPGALRFTKSVAVEISRYKEG